MKKIIVIVGPTGVGKTKLSIELAKKFNGEVINGDAIQVYEGLNIGSAKIKKEEMEDIPHHLFSIKNVNEEYSIYNYQGDCRKKIEEIENREKTPIIVGGTGLYIKSALFDYQLEKENKINNYEEYTTEELYNKLILLDKNIDIDKNNRRRVVRALNYYETNGSSISDNKNGNNLLYEAVFIGLTVPRDILYERINNRVDKMLNDGLISEVKEFYDLDIRTKPLLSGIGYKELYSYFDGEIGYSEAIRLIKRNSRRYAKRQYTFFNNQFNVKWFNTNYDNFNETIENVITYINNML